MAERKKTATASAQVFYGIEQEDLPKVGGYNIILDSQNNPLCITKTTKVYVVLLQSLKIKYKVYNPSCS